MRTSTLTFLTAFGLLIAGAIVGKYLESSGIVTRERLGPRGIATVMLVFFALFCTMALAVVPILLRAFIGAQVKVGNAELWIIKWLQAHEQTAVHVVWGLFATGLVIAFVLAREEILHRLR